MTVAEQEVPSGLAALIIGAVPLWVVLMRLRERRPARPRARSPAWSSASSGSPCSCFPATVPSGAPLWGVLLIVLASISWASGSFYSKRMDLPGGRRWCRRPCRCCSAAATMIVAGLVAGEAGEVDPSEFSTRLSAGPRVPDHVRLDARLHRLHVAAGNAPISTVTTYAYVNPVIALALGAAILSEEITLTVLSAPRRSCGGGDRGAARTAGARMPRRSGS